MFAGKPDERSISQFKHSVTDGVDVYLHPLLEVEPDGMQISLDRWAFMKRLRVKGVAISQDK